MRLNKGLRDRLIMVAILAVIGAMAGMGYVAARGMAEGDGALRALAQGAFNGLFIAAALFSFELLVVPSRLSAWLRRLSFIVGLLDRVLISTVIIVAVLLAGNRLVPWMFGEPSAPYPLSGLARDVTFSFVVFFVIHFAVQVVRLVGGRVLLNFIVGRYHRPVHEQRVFLFADLVGSTGIARRLGDEGTHALISRVFFDLDDVIAEHGGEIHRYVGDEVVVTWPLAEGLRDARCLRCWLAMEARLAERGAWYEKTFGQRPRLHAGMHGGPVVAGECGDRRREIVYFGDTVNATARIAAACHQLDRSFLMSQDLLSRLDLPAGMPAEPAGRVVLRGREEETELYSFAPMSAGATLPAVPA